MKALLICLIQVIMFNATLISAKSDIPIVITTWPFTNASSQAWKTINERSALDAIEEGCSTCEREQCDLAVGYGGSPDFSGETTQDSMIMDGNTMNVGAVADLRRIKNAISVARQVLDRTTHSILAGDQATKFAVSLGFKEEVLATSQSLDIWEDWKRNGCQPNFWLNVYPDARKSCGPFQKDDSFIERSLKSPFKYETRSHDTIGMVAIDSKGNVASGTSTNGLPFKVPGRVGDSPFPGAGSYADSTVGGAACTGNGDIMIRFSPSFFVVEELKRGVSPKFATENAIRRIAKYYPDFVGAVVAVNLKGEFGAACNGLGEFSYCVAKKEFGGTKVHTVKCI